MMAEEREHALRHLKIKLASRGCSEEELASKVAAQVQTQVRGAQGDLDVHRVAREFADAHHSLFAWPDEVSDPSDTQKPLPLVLNYICDRCF